jgi:hypothetical protein
MMGKGGNMRIDELRDKAALIAFQFLLENSDYKKELWVDTNTLSDSAWELADRFIEKRGGKRRGCSLLNKSMDEIQKEAMALGHITNLGAGPVTLERLKELEKEYQARGCPIPQVITEMIARKEAAAKEKPAAE